MTHAVGTAAGVHTGALDRAAASVAARAAALDEQRTDVRADLVSLGEAGLFESALNDADLPDMVRVIDRIAEQSLAAAFASWAHTMAVQYVRRAPEPLRQRHLDELRSGNRVGVTAMAAGLKHVAGLGDLPVVAQRRDDGLGITGPIRWASNLFDGALVVVPAKAPTGESYVTVVDLDAPGVTVDPFPPLMALGATASTSLRLQDVHVPADRIVSADLFGFVREIRPTFLLLQTAFCVGVARAALGGAALATGTLADQFAGDLRRLISELAALDDRLYALAATRPSAPAVTRLRLDAATHALAATRLESTVVGGAGYAVGSPANRRFREAAFLPVQSPSEGQLRWELTQYA
jgi:alkylation response protein AidB-like acyl-CoA dehydrogenase